MCRFFSILLTGLTLILVGCSSNTTQLTKPHPVHWSDTSRDAKNIGSNASLESKHLNDPSAPLNTPLCGIAAQGQNAIGYAIMPQGKSQVCASFACFDPLTSTYIGLDGYRHICR